MNVEKKLAQFLVDTGHRAFDYILGYDKAFTQTYGKKSFTIAKKKNWFDANKTEVVYFRYEGEISAAPNMIKYGPLPDTLFVV